jgi:hypothetical protein
MAKFFDATRLAEAASSIANGLRPLLAKPYPQLTAGEKLLAQSRALNMLAAETLDALGSLARETPAQVAPMRSPTSRESESITTRS